MTFEEAVTIARERGVNVVAYDKQGNIAGAWDSRDPRVLDSARAYDEAQPGALRWELTDVTPGDTLAMFVGAKGAPKA